jgi:pimeloyl-ACP methyl ester carboxylesterase
MATPGILYVTMAPQPSLPTAQFHDWYNNEHGPGRLRLPFVENGFRYRATDLEGPGKGLPEWMAIYDITDMAEMNSETYLRLRRVGVQSQRERDTMKQIKVDRRLLNSAGGQTGEGFRKLEDVAMEGSGRGNVMVAVSVTVHPGEDKVEELNKWYTEEHIPMLSKVPGWLRTRRFVTSPLQGSDEVEYLALHEYATENGLGGPEFVAATSTKWGEEIRTNVMKEKRRRVYELYYTFGAASRDLAPLESPDTIPFTSVDEMTKTYPATQTSRGAIESYVTTKDGVVLPYRLEGNTDPNAPLIVLSNSILVQWGIWDDFISAFLSTPQGSRYRILRYHTRGRTSSCGSSPITVDVLASDIIALLDALRVPKAAALIGVSLGGATVLRAALSYPDRVAAFVSCDTNAKSPAGNQKAWGERIALSESEGAVAATGDGEKEGIVGEKLAEITVRRWFVPESYDGGALEKKIIEVKKMVERNSLEGFKRSVAALYEYNMTPELRGGAVKGAFLVGGGDGVLPASMKEMAGAYGEKGGEYFVIEGAGHLPMVEKPKEMAEVVGKFLSS